ncbi:MAG TPA: hypothetical protein VGB28_01070, partial [Actinomycetota bacterium]
MRPARRTLILSTAVLAALLTSVAALATPIGFSASGANGAGQTDQPGVPCADEGGGASWTYGYGALLPGGAFSSLPTELALGIDLHSDVSAPDAAWLELAGSSVGLDNERGSVRLALEAGSCEGPVFAFNGTFASGGGIWTLAEGMGSYREASGSGTFSLLASVGPGSDNPFSLDLSGQVEVLQPALAVEVAGASWMPGPDPGSRVAAVTYRVTNAGPGDAFGVTLAAAGTSTPGVTGLGPTPQVVGDIPAGGEALAGVSYAFERGPCQLKDRGCALDADLSLDLADALDAGSTLPQVLRV